MKFSQINIIRYKLHTELLFGIHQWASLSAFDLQNLGIFLECCSTKVVVIPYSDAKMEQHANHFYRRHIRSMEHSLRQKQIKTLPTVKLLYTFALCLISYK